MPRTTFQFRQCQNPDCGLRYPLIADSEYGERCPMCLGATVVAASTTTEREVRADKRPIAPLTAPQALLDNVRSAWNVGSIFRSAEGFGFSHLYLCGITPSPTNEQVSKTALGAQDIVGWSSHRNAVLLLATLKRHGHAAWALERTADSLAIEAAREETPGQLGPILIVGNEQAGIDPGLLELADKIVHIEMVGQKRSFNVAVAFAVAAHQMAMTQERGQLGAGEEGKVSLDGK